MADRRLTDPFERRPSRFVPVFLAIVLVAIAASCEALKKTRTPEQSWVLADRATHDVISPRFAAYVDADDTLDPEMRRLLEGLLSDWNWRLEQSEAAVGAD